jgi:hypothetical protein
MAELSVIIPFVNEYPQVLFTIRSIMEELRGRVDYEIIVVDNYCKSMELKGHHKDLGAESISAVVGGTDRLKLLRKKDKLSHWNAKHLAIEHSTAPILWFADAHVVPSRDSLFEMFKYYQKNHLELDGTLHMPLTYQILEWRYLIYKLDVDLSLGKVHYSFDDFRQSGAPYQVPCMSSCGMMITKSLYDYIGGLPPQLGAYGGGENFINFTLAVLGKKVWIWPGLPLYHHGARRGYPINGKDIMRNRGIATYLFGGQHLLRLLMSNVPDRFVGNDLVREKVCHQIISQCLEHREMIKTRQVSSIEEWVSKWQGVA